MRKYTLLVLVATLLFGGVGAAEADSATVSGTSDISKMVVQNNADELVVKVYGPGKNAVRSVQVDVRDRQGHTYRAMGAWYGAEFISSLEKGQRLVTCDGYKLTYRSGFWKFAVPRTCVGKLAGTVKVEAGLVSNTSAIPGEAGPSGWVPRG